MVKRVSNHGTQGKEQSQVEHYKSLENYKELTIAKDRFSDLIKNIYDNNIWNLKQKLVKLQKYYEQIDISTNISWENGVQYLDLPEPIEPIERSLNALLHGDYRKIATDKKENALK